MLKQQLSQKLLQKLSPQQIQLMKLLQVPTVELEQRIKQEIEENPALEEGAESLDSDMDLGDEMDDRDVTEAEQEFDINDYLDDDIPQYQTSSRNTGPDEEEKAVPLAHGSTFRERLMSQLGLRSLDSKQEKIAETIIGNLDESGYLRREVENLVDDLAFSLNVMASEDEILDVLEIVQELDPPGVAARDLRECLLLQIRRKEYKESVEIAQQILQRCYQEFTKKHYEKILSRLSITEDQLREATEEIIKLNPKPGGSSKEAARGASQIVPDFILNESDGELSLSLNSRNAPELKVSRQYEQMLRAYAEGGKKSKSEKDAIMFVKQKIDSAKWFIDAIRQRQQTLMFTMQAIVDYQHEYFLTGDETNMRPMILKDIADMVGLDISTISRVANSKYVQSPYGIFPLKYFFSESLSTDTGEEVSTREVKKILQEAVEGEEKRKPLTDEALAKLLKDKGYNIARRTVAKYREQLNIPVARLRREL